MQLGTDHQSMQSGVSKRARNKTELNLDSWNSGTKKFPPYHRQRLHMFQSRFTTSYYFFRPQ